MSARRKKNKGRPRSRGRRWALVSAASLTLAYALFAIVANWFVHHPRQWIDAECASIPRFIATPLLWVGNGFADLTDALGFTGHDVVYDYDTDPPAGQVLFAGAPRRTGDLQPKDITVLDRGEFLVGWSPSLRRPAWCAYHVTAEARNPAGKRPDFSKDREASNAPAPSDYNGSGYDRGHMVPNHAIESRYGESAQRKTFLMSNIAPQSASLNRGVWRNLEHRIADLWTARYGEIWVVVGSVPNGTGLKLGSTGVEIPEKFFQVIVAQEGMDVRVLALLFPQDTPWGEWAARHIVSIDELEEATGLDFLPDLPPFIQDPLEAERPTRLWPIRTSDVFRLLALRYD